MHRRIIISLILLCLLCTGCGGASGQVVLSEEKGEISDATNVVYTDLQTTVQSQAVSEQVAVYVCGAVVSPGVYYLPMDSIKQDALDAAGGFLEGAATTYVNLAEPIEEGEQIYFPFEDELSYGYSPITGQDSGKVNLNRATKEELMTLPGIGESKAEAIITYREEYGAFQSIEEITSIPGIKEGIYDNIKDYIVVD